MRVGNIEMPGRRRCREAAGMTTGRRHVELPGRAAGCHVDPEHRAGTAMYLRRLAAIGRDEDTVTGHSKTLRVVAIVEAGHPNPPDNRGLVGYRAERPRTVAGAHAEDRRRGRL